MHMRDAIKLHCYYNLRTPFLLLLPNVYRPFTSESIHFRVMSGALDQSFTRYGV